MRRPSPTRRIFSKEPSWVAIKPRVAARGLCPSSRFGRLERIHPHFPEGTVEARGPDDRVAFGELLELRHRPEGTVSVDGQRLLVTSQHELDLVAAGLG